MNPYYSSIKIPNSRVEEHRRFLEALCMWGYIKSCPAEIVYRENNLSFNGNRTARIRTREIENLVFDPSLGVWTLEK